MEPIYRNESDTLGHSNIDLTAESWDEGKTFLDTKVEINGELLCHISYPEKDFFMKELQDVISKYRI